MFIYGILDEIPRIPRQYKNKIVFELNSKYKNETITQFGVINQ